jgi:coenzyme F420 hydrogenase subunit beta
MTVAAVVANDLCIGCGLCEAVTRGRVSMTMTERGGLRPDRIDLFTATEEEMITTACPGVVAESRAEPDGLVDPIWGSHKSMIHAWAADPDIRYRAATGGVLTALACFLLETGAVTAVLHVGAEPDQPMRSRWVLSTDSRSVIANASSRYGPTAPLAGLVSALDGGEPFAVVAKPCDLGALHRYARADPRVDELCVARLALVCGGQSRLAKSQVVLDDLGLTEDEISLFRYRGHGNPGPTRISTHDGRSFEKTYLELWEDEAGWELETRCKLCPDALGEAADLAAADAWPGGAPVADDEGFNAVVVRTAKGEQLVSEATEAGYLVIGEAIAPRQFDDLQPHQVRKKEALAARYTGLVDAGVRPIETIGLRIDELGRRLDPVSWETERSGAARRMEALDR